MNNAHPAASDLTPGAAFQIQANDPTKPGSLVWLNCTVVDGIARETETRGIDVYAVRREDGRTVYATLAQLRKAAQS